MMNHLLEPNFIFEDFDEELYKAFDLYLSEEKDVDPEEFYNHDYRRYMSQLQDFVAEMRSDAADWHYCGYDD
jgi:hypothetical protein